MHLLILLALTAAASEIVEELAIPLDTFAPTTDTINVVPFEVFRNHTEATTKTPFNHTGRVVWRLGALHSTQLCLLQVNNFCAYPHHDRFRHTLYVVPWSEWMCDHSPIRFDPTTNRTFATRMAEFRHMRNGDTVVQRWPIQMSALHAQHLCKQPLAVIKQRRDVLLRGYDHRRQQVWINPELFVIVFALPVSVTAVLSCLRVRR